MRMFKISFAFSACAEFTDKCSIWLENLQANQERISVFTSSIEDKRKYEPVHDGFLCHKHKWIPKRR